LLVLKDGRRRRSPGGVFIQLIKRDISILSEQKKKIFELKPEEKKQKKKHKRFKYRLINNHQTLDPHLHGDL
jgi:phosphorylated adapter RNA export protein